MDVDKFVCILCAYFNDSKEFYYLKEFTFYQSDIDRVVRNIYSN